VQQNGCVHAAAAKEEAAAGAREPELASASEHASACEHVLMAKDASLGAQRSIKALLRLY
jgi:hypothetical protein